MPQAKQSLNRAASKFILTPYLQTPFQPSCRWPCQQSLLHRSIAVALGKESQGLCAICFNDQKTLNRFYNNNPALHCTLITRGPKGLIFWVRIIDLHPPTKEFNGFAWLAANVAIVFHSRDSSASNYEIVRSATPVQIPFSQIRWDTGVAGIFDFSLSEIRHGSPRSRRTNGRWETNELFWSAHIAWLLRIQYHSGQRCYYQREADANVWRMSDQVSLLNQISRGLTGLSKLPNCGYLLDHRRPTKLRALLRSMQITASTTFLGESGNELERLLSEMLEPAAGADVTSEKF